MIAYKYTFLLLIPSFIHAQSIKPEWGDQIIPTRNSPVLKRIVKGQPDELIAIGLRWTPNALNLPDTYVATRLDKDLKPVMERDLFSTRYRDDFHDVYNFKGNVFLFTRQFNRNEKMTYYYYKQIDPATLQTIDSNAIGHYKAINRGWQPEIKIKFSTDTSHILLFSEAANRYPWEEPKKFYISVRDHHMHKLWEKEITLSYINKFFMIEGFEISNDGDVYVLCKHYNRQVIREGVREKGVIVPSYTYKVLIVRENDDKPREHIVQLPNRFVHAMTLQFDNDGTIHLVGLYKEKRNGNVSGHFIAALDKNAPQTTIKKLEPFPVDDLLQLLYKDFCASINTNDPGLWDRFRIMGTNNRSDGSVDLLTEFNYSSEEREGSILDSNRTNSTHTVYDARDILVINYKKDGQVFYTRIPKWQSERSDALISFKWMNQGDQLLLFYLDSESNVKKDLSKRPDALFILRSVFVVASVNDKGKLQRQMAYSHKETEFITALNVCSVVDTHTLALYTERARVFSKSKFQFGRLKL